MNILNWFFILSAKKGKLTIHYVKNEIIYMYIYLYISYILL